MSPRRAVTSQPLRRLPLALVWGLLPCVAVGGEAGSGFRRSAQRWGGSGRGFSPWASTAGTLVAGIAISQWAYLGYAIRYVVSALLTTVFLNLFMFAVGLKVGPQFSTGLRRDGVKGVAIAVNNGGAQCRHHACRSQDPALRSRRRPGAHFRDDDGHGGGRCGPGSHRWRGLPAPGERHRRRSLGQHSRSVRHHLPPGPRGHHPAGALLARASWGWTRRPPPAWRRRATAEAAAARLGSTATRPMR